MTVFNSDNTIYQRKQPLFFGETLGIQRYDMLTYPIFDKLTQTQLGFFWRPEEVNLQKDRADYSKIPEEQRHIFTSNLKYQILLDSVQGRGPALAFLPFVSNAELEACIIAWDFFETIHSRSYMHMIRSIYADPSEVFDHILDDDQILERAHSVSTEYDKFIEMGIQYQSNSNSIDLYELKKQLYLAMISVNILEGIRFYISFACTFAFGELKTMEGSAKIIKFISRDESQHYAITQNIFKIWRNDPEMSKIAEECHDHVIRMFKKAVEEEKIWASYLFKDGSMIGLNEILLCQYVEWIANKRMKALGFEPIYEDAPKHSPLPWTENWLSNKSVQVAPQETEISSYLVGATTNDIDDQTFEEFSL